MNLLVQLRLNYFDTSANLVASAFGLVYCDMPEWIDSSIGPVNLHASAKAGKLLEVPRELLTGENMLRGDSFDCTPLHYAAERGCLGQIPEAVLTSNLLMVTDYRGDTPVHYAADKGKLYLIPAGLLTADVLLATNSVGTTPLHYAARYGELAVIRSVPGVVTVERMLISDKFGLSPLDNADLHGHLDQVLGLDFPESVRSFVGEEWWERNQALLRDMALLADTDQESVDVDIF